MDLLNKNYSLVETQDGSVSLEYSSDSTHKEVMHHSGGAVKESLYIYLPALTWAIDEELSDISVLSVGTGLGVNEMITAATFVKHNINNGHIDSFEADQWLTASFSEWIIGNDTELNTAYDKNLSIICNELNTPKAQVQQKLSELVTSDRLNFHGPVLLSTQYPRKYHVIFYDFFSSKMNELFWQQEFLEGFLLKTAEQSCAVSTYAAKSALKKALKRHEFDVHKKLGFSGKRESTFATRT